MAISNTNPNPKDVVILQRDDTNTYYGETHVSGSQLLLHINSAGHLDADTSSSFYSLYPPPGGSSGASVSSSWASQSFWSVSASFASQSISASWAPSTPSNFAVSASWASQSIWSISSSFASQSISSSFSISASWAPGGSSVISSSWASSSLTASVLYNPHAFVTLNGDSYFSNSVSINTTPSFSPLTINGESIYGSIFFTNNPTSDVAGIGLETSNGNSVNGTKAGDLAIWTNGNIDFSANNGVSVQLELSSSGDLYLYDGILVGTASNAISASWAPSVPSDFAVSASWASQSIWSVSASFASQSISSSYSKTASFVIGSSPSSSWASQSIWAISASFASQSISSSYSQTASFVIGSSPSSSWASQSIWSVSSSFASQSLSSSYAFTSSYFSPLTTGSNQLFLQSTDGNTYPITLTLVGGFQTLTIGQTPTNATNSFIYVGSVGGSAGGADILSVQIFS